MSATRCGLNAASDRSADALIRYSIRNTVADICPPDSSPGGRDVRGGNVRAIAARNKQPFVGRSLLNFFYIDAEPRATQPASELCIESADYIHRHPSLRLHDVTTFYHRRRICCSYIHASVGRALDSFHRVNAALNRAADGLQREIQIQRDSHYRQSLQTF